MTKPTQYTEENIRSLDWKEHIRMRPGMYIGKLGDGSSQDDGIYILLKEILDNCIDEHLLGKLTVEKAAMAKYWLSDTQGEVLDECLQLHGGYGYMQEYDIAEMWTDARVQRIYGGTNEVMKELISRKFSKARF